jgi:hypothetical protein
VRWSRVRRQAVRLLVPAFLALALLLGGSSVPDTVGRAWLTVTAIILLMASLPLIIRPVWTPAALAGAGLVAAWLVWILLQLIPLPAILWGQLGGRDEVATGLSLLAMPEATAMPVSLSPEQSWNSLYGFLPPIAALALIGGLGWRKSIAQLNWAIPLFGAASAALGLAQVLSEGDTALYFHAFTNRGLPVGFFANVNHQACFLLMCLPFIAALIGEASDEWQSGDADYGRVMAIGVLGLFVLVGILAAGSVAGYSLLLPVLIFCILLVRSPGQGKARLASPILIITSTILGALLVGFSPVLDGLGVTSFEETEMSRLGMWKVTTRIAADHWVAGTGLGSFSDVYRLYENPETVTEKFANHAHNDYLQTIVEFGLPGLLLIVAGLGLAGYLFVRVWLRRGDSNARLKRAAATAIFVVLLHSVVDYPGRTPAIATLSAACFGILVVGREKRHERPQRMSEKPDMAPGDGKRLVI